MRNSITSLSNALYLRRDRLFVTMALVRDLILKTTVLFTIDLSSVKSNSVPNLGEMKYDRKR